MPSTPTSAVDVLDTFHSIAACPITGWDKTICGTYDTIRDVVNARMGTTYSTTDIGWALTWLHEHGPDECGATVSKNGPGNRKTLVKFEDGSPAVVVDGSVYMLVIDGQPLVKERRRVLVNGLVEWCDYRISSIRNDIIDLSMVRGSYPASNPAYRTPRRNIQKTIISMATEVTVIQDLKATLIAAV